MNGRDITALLMHIKKELIQLEILNTQFMESDDETTANHRLVEIEIEDLNDQIHRHLNDFDDLLKVAYNYNERNALAELRQQLDLIAGSCHISAHQCGLK
jgi:hypothetical protein